MGEAKEKRGVHRPTGNSRAGENGVQATGVLSTPSFFLESRAAIEGFKCGAVRVQFVLWKNCFRSETSVRSG